MPRPIGSIRHSSKFERKYRNLPPEYQRAAEAKEALFRKDAFHPSLGTHKLHGSLEGSWAFKVAYDIRIVFRFLGEASAVFLTIGSHDAVY